jgi:hypothetical protein
MLGSDISAVAKICVILVMGTPYNALIFIS